MIDTWLANRYRLLAELGRGGMGVVYQAQDVQTGAVVAIKALAPAQARQGEFLARFAREAQALAALRHPNIVGLVAMSLS